MSGYKHTLNLPKTKFPMRANLAQREPDTLRFWGDINIYQKLRETRRGCPTFILHDGPPYANGDVHLGHAVNKILKDIVMKAKTLSGYDTPYILNWDCHGLPIELNVEKKVGKPGRKVSVEIFRQTCRQYAKKQVDKQSATFQRLGVVGDWEHTLTTMDYRYEADTIRALGKIIENKHIQRGFKPVYWCIDCGSALAEAEVEYQNKHSPAIDVRFRVLDDQALIDACHHVPESYGIGPLSVPIWTTTPWTLPANRAVCVHPDFTYAVVQGQSERWLVAEDLLKDVMWRYGEEDYRVLAYCQGKALEGLRLQHPFYDREVPIVLGHHVTAEAGTGAVHTAPAHGQDDYVVGSRYGLSVDQPVGANGCFLPDVPIFAGEHVWAANDHVIETLKMKGTLIHHDAIDHSYPHCWRHKTPLIFRATPQWFIDLDQAGLRDNALQCVKQIDWVIKWGEARMTDMIQNRPDWCISRQRVWGVPIALFIHRETGEMHPDTIALMEKVASLVEQKGVEAWHALDAKTFIGDDAEQYVKVTDTLDVWFDSGVSHFAVLKEQPDLAFPADLYLEGADQYRGWFQSSLLTACAIEGEAPYRQVLSHGFVVDADGRKMSKSLGNVVFPEKVMKTLGADILRLWTASADYRVEMACSDDILKRTTDVYRRIRNTARFLLSNLHDFHSETDCVPADQLLVLDAWAVQKTQLLQQDLQDLYDTYQFHLIYQKIHHFCSIELGSFYLDIIKDRQYTARTDGLPRRSAQTAMFYMIEALVRWIAPILSFTAEEIWQCLPNREVPSVLLSQWYDQFPAISGDMAMGVDFWQQVMTIRDAVNKQIECLRNEKILGSALEAEVTLYADQNYQDLLQSLEDELRFVLITSVATVLPIEQAPDDAVETDLAGLTLKIVVSPYPKCERCWHRREDVGHDPEHPTLCGRCLENIGSVGETRRFA